MNKLFGIYDEVAKSYCYCGIAPTAPAFIRSVVPMLVRSMSLGDCKVYELGTFNDRDFEAEAEKILHDWSEYKFPESPAENLAPLGAEVVAQLKSLDDAEKAKSEVENA